MKKILPFIFILTLLFSAAVSAQGISEIKIGEITTSPAEGKQGTVVQVPFTFTNPNNPRMKALDPAQITILEDGNPITNWQLIPDQELTELVILLDSSKFMEGESFEHIKESLPELLDKLDTKTNIKLITFDIEIGNPIDLNRPKFVNRVINDLRTSLSSGCPHDALIQTLITTRVWGNDKHAIVLITASPDGEDNCSDHSPQNVIDRFDKQNPIPVSTVGIGNLVDAIHLEQYAIHSGGVFAKAQTPEDVDLALKKIFGAISGKYLIEYTSPNVSGTHTIDIKVDINGEMITDHQTFIINEQVASDVSDLTKPTVTLTTEPTVEENSPEATSEEAITPEPTNTPTLEPSATPTEAQAIVPEIVDPGTPMPINEEQTETPKVDLLDLFNKLKPVLLGAVLIVALFLLLIMILRLFTSKSETVVIKEVNSFGTLEILKTIDASMVGTSRVITKTEMILGRDLIKCDIAFPNDRSLASQHCRLLVTKGGIRVVPVGNGSNAGIVLNQDTVPTSGLVVKSGDQLKLGSNTILRFVL